MSVIKNEISVVIPVGPFEANKRWLQECLDSIAGQTITPAGITIIEDGAKLRELDWLQCWEPEYGQFNQYGSTYQDDNMVDIEIYPMPWRTGISHAFNYGVMLSYTECVFMLGSDDTLEPNCLAKCMEAYEKNNQQPAYYSVPIRYMDDLTIQTAPCNAAMTTKTFWKQTGGFPIETAIGIGDSTFLSICIKHKLPVRWVGEDTGQPDVPLYNYRRHPDIHTYKLGPWWGVVDSIRNIATEQWNADKIKEWSGNYGS